MLESEIKKLTSAIEANTAALTGGEAAVAPVAPPPPAAAAKTDTQAAGAAAPAAAAPAAAIPPAAAPPAAAGAAAAGAAAAPAAAVIEVDKKALTQKFIELAQVKGRESAQQLLAEYGVSSLPELKDKAQWPAFFAACDAKITG